MKSSETLQDSLMLSCVEIKQQQEGDFAKQES
jgi:hypothetical protein